MRRLYYIKPPDKATWVWVRLTRPLPRSPASLLRGTAALCLRRAHRAAAAVLGAWLLQGHRKSRGRGTCWLGLGQLILPKMFSMGHGQVLHGKLWIFIGEGESLRPNWCGSQWSKRCPFLRNTLSWSRGYDSWDAWRLGKLFGLKRAVFALKTHRNPDPKHLHSVQMSYFEMVFVWKYGVCVYIYIYIYIWYIDILIYWYIDILIYWHVLAYIGNCYLYMFLEGLWFINGSGGTPFSAPSPQWQALRSDAKPLSPMACALAVLPVADVRLASETVSWSLGLFWVNLGWIVLYLMFVAKLKWGCWICIPVDNYT